MVTMDLREYIRDVQNFPRAGVLFRDIGPLLANAEAFHYCIDAAVRMASSEKPTSILAIESRGFLFATPIAMRLGVPVILARKTGKLPGKCMSVQYGLEYGTATLEMQVGAIRAGDRVLIVDDVLATGGTAAAAESLVEMGNAQTAAMLFVIELTYLKGRETLETSNIHTLIQY